MPSGIAIDGTNVKTEVPKHTVSCLLLEACINSNYVLQQQLSDGTYAPVYNLSNSSTPTIVVFLKTLQRADNAYVEVMGILDASGSLVISAISDAFGGSPAPPAPHTPRPQLSPHIPSPPRPSGKAII